MTGGDAFFVDSNLLLCYVNGLKRRIGRLEKALFFWPVRPKLSEVSYVLALMEFGREQMPWAKNNWPQVEEVVCQAEAELLHAFTAICRRPSPSPTCHKKTPKDAHFDGVLNLRWRL
jgi:hypothetical protein